MDFARHQIIFAWLNYCTEKIRFGDCQIVFVFNVIQFVKEQIDARVELRRAVILFIFTNYFFHIIKILICPRTNTPISSCITAIHERTDDRGIFSKHTRIRTRRITGLIGGGLNTPTDVSSFR